MTTAAIYKKADDLSQELEFFYCGSAGKGLDKIEEMAILLEWADAIAAATARALELRDWVGVDCFDAMMSECEWWLKFVAEEEAEA